MSITFSPRAIVMDIEGTISSLTFVKDVLFPYARQHIAAYVRDNAATLEPLFADIRQIEGKPELDIEGIITTLIGWIDADRKITPLKELQGRIWKTGFEQQAFKGHIYADAAERLRAWHAAGIPLYIYSSGSVAAQKLLFGFSEYGDFTTILSGYFDTTTGPKLEAASYTLIAQKLALPPADILFLSDHAGEVTAARAAGYQVALLDRECTGAQVPFPVATTFTDLEIGVPVT